MQEKLHIESSVKIYFTRDYGRFKWLKGNRSLNEAKVKKIMNAISDGVNILKYAPIIVNEKMEIIDGQHRFMVSKQLKENVWYVIQEQADLSIVPAINSNSSNWKKIDFLNSYCDMGKQAYILIRELTEQFHGLQIMSAATMIHSGKIQDTIAKEHFKDGLICKNFEAQTLKVLYMLNDFSLYTQNPFSSRFISVMNQLHNNGKYDHAHMCTKLNESGYKIEELKSDKTIITNMEAIYNHKMKSRLFIS